MLLVDIIALNIYIGLHRGCANSIHFCEKLVVLLTNTAGSMQGGFVLNETLTMKEFFVLVVLLCLAASTLFSQHAGHALQFDGFDDEVYLGSNKILPDGAFSIAYWVYPGTPFGSSGYWFLGRFKSSTEFFFAQNPTTGLGFSFRNLPQYYANAPLSVNEWHHYVIIYNGGDKNSTASYSAYRDGLPLALTQSTIAGGATNDNILGRDHFVSSPGATTFKGMLDELSIWSRVLTQQEIEGMMNRHLVVSDSGLVSYWPFEEGSGDYTNDEKSRTNIGSLVGGTAWTNSTAPVASPSLLCLPLELTLAADSVNGVAFDTVVIRNLSAGVQQINSASLIGDDHTSFSVNPSSFTLASGEKKPLAISFVPASRKYHFALLEVVGDSGTTQIQITGSAGRAIQFDGVDDIISINPNPSLTAIVDNFTFEAWVYPYATHGIDPESNSGTAGTSGQRYLIYPSHGEGDYDVGHAGVGISVGTNGVSIYEHANSYLPSLLTWQGQLYGWTHIALVYRNKQPELYINGVLVRIGLQSTRVHVHPSLGTLSVEGFGGGGYGHYSGKLDHVRFWNMARTPSEILCYYDRYVSKLTPGLTGYWDFEEAIANQVCSDSSSSDIDGILGSSTSVSTDDPARISSFALVKSSRHNAQIIRMTQPDQLITLDTIVTPTLLVRNYAEYLDTIHLNIQIDSQYTADGMIILSAGDSDIVTFPPWHATNLGVHTISCYTSFTGDDCWKSDTLSRPVAVVVNGSQPVIFSITPDTYGNLGNVSVTIDGIGFQPGATARLAREGYQSIEGMNTIISDSSTITTQFDITNRQLGSWDVVVDNPGGQSTSLINGFTIDEGFENLWVEVIGRSVIRAGREATYLIRYGNSGNTLLRRTLVEIVCTGGLLYSSIPSAFEDPVPRFVLDTLFFLTSNLLPNKSLSFPIQLQSTVTGVPVYLKARILDASEYGEGILLTSAIHQPNLPNSIIPTALQDFTAVKVNLDVQPTIDMDGALLVNSGFTSHSGTLLNFENGWFVAENLTDPSPSQPSGYRLTPWQIYVDRMRAEKNNVYGVNIPMNSTQRENLKNWSLNEAVNPRGDYHYVSWKCTDAVSQGYRIGAGIEWFPLVNPITTPMDLVLYLTGSLPEGLPPISVIGSFSPAVVLLKLWLDIETLNRYAESSHSETNAEILVVNSWDPNEKAGPSGYGESNYVSLAQPFPYIVYFENKDSATAAAQEIEIKDTLDADLDWSSFAFDDFQIGDTTFSIFDTSQALNLVYQLNDTTEVIVEGSFNSLTGIVRWYMKGRDTRTSDFGDFLPPNVNSPEGEGWVSFSVRTKSDLVTGTEIKNRASIVFDVNPAILTNEVLNTIDAGDPASQITETSSSPDSGSIRIKWFGMDDSSGSGVNSYSLYAEQDQGAFQQYQANATDTALSFPAQLGHTYRFMTLARDNVGNLEGWKSITDPAVAALYHVSSRWNMVSLSLKVDDSRKNILFPTAISPAFRFDPNEGYQVGDSLFNGVGYWTKFSQDEYVLQKGMLHSSDTIDVVQGWNMVGSISTPIPVSNVISNPAGIVTSQFFGYQGSYQASDTIQPGKAYWIKVNQSGQLILSVPTEGVFHANTIKIVQTNEFPPPPPDESNAPDPLPKEYALEQNYPNPFNPLTVIRYQLPVQSRVTLTIFNLLGQKVQTLVHEDQAAGFKSVEWNASNVASGMYFYRLQVNSFVDTKKLLLLR